MFQKIPFHFFFRIFVFRHKQKGKKSDSRKRQIIPLEYCLSILILFCLKLSVYIYFIFSIESNFLVFSNRENISISIIELSIIEIVKSEKKQWHNITILVEFLVGLKKQSQIVLLTTSILEFICINKELFK